MPDIKNETIVNSNTGEIRHQRSKVIRFSLFNEDKGYLLFMNNSQVRTFPHVEWPEGVMKLDRANLFELSRHIYSNTNMLAYRGNRNALRPMGEEQMSQVVGLCDQRFKKWLSRMIKLGMIARINVDIEETTTTQYYLNPLYFFSDKYLPLNLYVLFQAQLDRYIPDWARRRYNDMIAES